MSVCLPVAAQAIVDAEAVGTKSPIDKRELRIPPIATTLFFFISSPKLFDVFGQRLR